MYVAISAVGGKCHVLTPSPDGTPPPVVGGTAVSVRGHVGHDVPVLRRVHGELVGRLHVRLIEARVDPVRVEGLQVRVHIDLAVSRIGEPVQALAAARVGAFGIDHKDVALREARNGDPLAVERG
jgi:hypothetical protein